MSRKRGRPKIKHGYVTGFDCATLVNPDVGKTFQDAVDDAREILENEEQYREVLGAIHIYKLELIAVIPYDNETREFLGVEFEEKRLTPKG